MRVKNMKNLLVVLLTVFSLSSNAQTGLKKVYKEDINPIEQIDQAIAKAKSEGKFVICQVGGNWCPWCLRFADFITNDTTIRKTTDMELGRRLAAMGYKYHKLTHGAAYRMVEISS